MGSTDFAKGEGEEVEADTVMALSSLNAKVMKCQGPKSELLLSRENDEEMDSRYLLASRSPLRDCERTTSIRTTRTATTLW
jgi:hypothetical protein